MYAFEKVGEEWRSRGQKKFQKASLFLWFKLLFLFLRLKTASMHLSTIQHRRDKWVALVFLYHRVCIGELRGALDGWDMGFSSKKSWGFAAKGRCLGM